MIKGLIIALCIAVCGCVPGAHDVKIESAESQGYLKQFPQVLKTHYSDLHQSHIELYRFGDYEGVIVGMGSIDYYPEFPDEYKDSCGQDKVVVYFIGSNTAPNPTSPTHPELWHKTWAMLEYLEGFVYLVDGSKYSNWPNCYVINLADKEIAEAYATLLYEHVYMNQSDNVDAWLLDNVWNTIKWANTNADIDLDRDGVADELDDIADAWKAGQGHFHAYLRELIGDDFIIMGNGRWCDYLSLNGGEYEWFPNHTYGYSFSDYNETVHDKCYSLDTRKSHCYKPFVNILHVGLHDVPYDSVLIENAVVAGILNDSYITFAQSGEPHYGKVIKMNTLKPIGPTQFQKARQTGWFWWLKDRKTIEVRPVRDTKSMRVYLAVFNPNDVKVKYHRRKIQPYCGEIMPRDDQVQLPMEAQSTIEGVR